MILSKILVVIGTNIYNKNSNFNMQKWYTDIWWPYLRVFPIIKLLFYSKLFFSEIFFQKGIKGFFLWLVYEYSTYNWFDNWIAIFIESNFDLSLTQINLFSEKCISSEESTENSTFKWRNKIEGGKKNIITWEALDFQSVVLCWIILYLLVNTGASAANILINHF